MSLSGYGILYGTVVVVRPPRTTETHWLVVVQPLDPAHPTYRVAIELGRNQNDQIGIEGQWCDLSKGSPAAKDVGKHLLKIAGGPNAPGYFVTQQDAGGNQVVGLDYVRSGVVPLDGFKPTINSADDPIAMEFTRDRLNNERSCAE